MPRAKLNFHAGTRADSIHVKEGTDEESLEDDIDRSKHLPFPRPRSRVDRLGWKEKGRERERSV